MLAGYLGLSAVLVSLFVLMAKLTGMDAALSFSRGFASLYLGEAGGLALGNVLQVALLRVICRLASPLARVSPRCSRTVPFHRGDFLALSHIAKQADRFEDACRVIASKFKLPSANPRFCRCASRPYGRAHGGGAVHRKKHC